MIGALVMAYGSPTTIDDVEAYYTHIRHGRPPTQAQLDDLVRRYEAIGGPGDLTAGTEAQRRALAAHLGDGWSVRLGHKHAAPFIEDGVAALVDDGVDAVVGVVLAPHYSNASIGEYHARAESALRGGAAYGRVDRWWDLDAHVEFLARAVRTSLGSGEPSAKVFFTAHSLPERVLVGDPYPDELRAGAALIAARAGLDDTRWDIAWQSAGRTPDPWRGPDIAEVIADLAASGRASHVVVVPHGFTTAHLEVRYDLDVAAADLAQRLGLEFARAAVIDADAAVMAALAQRVTEAVP